MASTAIAVGQAAVPIVQGAPVEAVAQSRAGPGDQAAPPVEAGSPAAESRRTSPPPSLETDVFSWPVLSVPAQPDVTAWSDEEKAAISFIKEVAIKVDRILENPMLPPQDRRLAIREVVMSEFEVDRLARILLGPHIAYASQSQIRAYDQVIPDYLVPLYAGQLRTLAEPDALIVDARDRGDAIFVRTALLGEMGERPLFVDWRVTERPDGTFRLLDMSVDGVSLAQAKRDEFDAVIANKGFGGFLDMIYDQANLTLPEPISTPLGP